MENGQQYDVVIIGGGLGGLLTGALLSKEGYNVCIVEKNSVFGGNLQTFKRNGVIFDTGMHYFGSADKGQFIYKLFKHLNIYDSLRLKRLDINGFDILNYQDKEYRFAQGFDNFTNIMSAYFPNDKRAVEEFVDRIKEVGRSENMFNLISKNHDDYFKVGAHYSQNVYRIIASITDNPVLQNVLSGLNGRIGGGREKTNMFVFGMTYYSYIESAWRFVGGSSQLTDALIEKIKQNGGTVINNNEVTEIILDDNRTAEYIKTDKNLVIKGKKFISNIHPVNTIKLLPKNSLRKVYVSRIKRLENSSGMFSIFLVLKQNRIKYQNYNYFDFNTKSTWYDYNAGMNIWPQGYIMTSQVPEQKSEFVSGITVMTPVRSDIFDKWINTTVEKRGQDYKDLKNELAERLLEKVYTRFPRFRGAVKTYYTATPLTYRDYTGTPDGSAYGLIKDSEKPFETLVLPKTHIRNLLLTGQNINVHGMLGVSTGSLLTISYITDIKKIIKSINNAG
jgi:phytoene dehydrogenase-like protein